VVWERGWLLATLLVYLLWSMVAGRGRTSCCWPTPGMDGILWDSVIYLPPCLPIQLPGWRSSTSEIHWSIYRQ